MSEYLNFKPKFSHSLFNSNSNNKKYHSSFYRLSKMNTRMNSIKLNKTHYNSEVNNNFSTFSGSKIFQKQNQNFINFVDRNKIRNIGLVSLKLFDDYIEENNKSIKTNNNQKNSPKKKDINLYKDYKRNSIKANFFNTNSNFINDENNMSNKLKKLSKDKNNALVINSYNNYNNNYIARAKMKLKNVRKKFSLHELMELNPYHYVSNIVKYSNSIQMKKISEKLGDIHGADFNIKATSQRHFFRGQSYKSHSKKHQSNKRVINSFQVTFNTNLSHKSGLVWRILQKFKLKRNNIIASFRQACKFKAYAELWKDHSMIIEKLLVNYNVFKWFYEKEKLMTEEVFYEFLECKKMEEELKGEISFAHKVFLAFDEIGLGEINIKTFFLVMEITSKSNNNLEKINFITNLVEEYNLRNEEKSVNLFDMYELFKCLIVYENSQKDSRNLYEAIKEDLNNREKIDSHIYITKHEVCNFLLNNKIIHKLIQGFKLQFKYANVSYIEEINSCFNSTVRNVKKFLNEQNEVMCDSENNYYKFEQVLKSIQYKNSKKDKTKKIEDEFDNDNIGQSFNE